MKQIKLLKNTILIIFLITFLLSAFNFYRYIRTASNYRALANAANLDEIVESYGIDPIEIRDTYRVTRKIFYISVPVLVILILFYGILEIFYRKRIFHNTSHEK